MKHDPAIFIPDLGVLVVDDNAEMCNVIRRMLIDMGMSKVTICKSGQDALKLLNDASLQSAIDVILCDWNMPGTSGIELLRETRKTKPDLPFLMITGNATKKFVSEAKKLGVTDYIAKPFAPLVLQKKIDAVARLLAKRRNNARLD